MRASKLILFLQQKIAEYGDGEAFIHDNDTDWLLEILYFRYLPEDDPETAKRGFVLAGNWYYDDQPPWGYTWETIDE
jgi:hypothetical protein